MTTLPAKAGSTLVVNTMGRYDKTVDQVEKDIKKAVKRAGEDAKNKLLRPTATWNHDVDFTVKMYESGDDLVCDVTTEDAPYFFVDGGTKERWAVMTNPFMPKTTPRSFIPSVGVGGLKFVMKKRKGNGGALPGITAREWTKMTAEEMQPILEEWIDRVVAMYESKLTVTAEEIHKSDWKPT